MIAVDTNLLVYAHRKDSRWHAAAATAQVEAWLASPTLVVVSEGPGYWDTLRGLVTASKAHGGQVHDARIAALCLHHRASELWTADRDFSRFSGLTTRNPLV